MLPFSAAPRQELKQNKHKAAACEQSAHCKIVEGHAEYPVELSHKYPV
jgi:hypothetical protein